jgi:short-subunit dehydrogenase
MALPAPAHDRTCIVTGASSGIGAELARLLAARGLGVTLVARREDKLRALADELTAQHGIRAEVASADLSDEASRHALVSTIADRGLEVDLLVNNAGLSTTGAVHQSEIAGELAMVRTDIEAIVHLCSAFLPGMVERGRGAILNVASTAAFQPLPGQAGYGASKAFVLSYSQAMAAELKGSGVTVTCLCPGPVHTGFGEAAGFSKEDTEGALPKFMWVDADKVAKAAVDAVAKGRTVVIPGMPNRVLANVSLHTPRRFVVPILAKQHPALKRR